jgi:hypothetical protein
MAKLTIITDTDSCAVWVWELLKKLGYSVEVVFGCDNHYPVCHHDALLPKIEGVKQLIEQCETSRKESRFTLASEQFNRKINYPKSSKNSKKRR